jgi:Deltex C-terminal domain
MQREFSRSGKDFHIDTGYHYTQSVNMSSIKQSGLLSYQERAQLSSPSANTNGSLFGDGIYTGNNPFSYHMFGGADLGLIVARLKGNVDVSSATSTCNVASTADTILGRAGSTDETCVLRSGSQCLALLQFNANTINIHRDDAVGNTIIYETQKRIQQVVDECFNKGRPKTVVRSLRATKTAVRAFLTPLQFMRNKVMLYHNSLVEIIYYEAPTTVETGWHHSQRPLWIDTKHNPQPFVLRFPQIYNDRQTQWHIHERWLPEIICTAPLPPDTAASSSGTTDASKTKPKFLFPCGRSIDISFARKGHKQDAFQWEEIFDNMPILKRLRKYVIDHFDKCKTCRRMHRTADGHVGVGVMPTGSMRIDAFPLYKCSGYDVGTYVISYRFNEGVQSGYHPSPDQPYMASYRVCFLPMSAEGTMLLNRLKVAFVQGLTTIIGTSKTTGFENSVIWASVPHKTKTTPGRYGYPDATFFEQANQALDLLGVARAVEPPIATIS